MFRFKPIIVTENDHALKLYNGDIGICLDPEGKSICFPSEVVEGRQTFREVNVSFLPTYELVYAMTVHKSQGSEYEACIMVVPEVESNQQKALLSREILYTAITRAKSAFSIAARKGDIAHMVKTPVERSSGLFES